MNSVRSISPNTLIPKLLVGILGNLAYFFYYHGSFPNCGTTCIIFFNIAFLCLFLPLLSHDVDRSLHLKDGAQVSAWIYFIVEAILCLTLLSSEKATWENALIWQIIVLALFLIFFFYNNEANRKSDIALKEARSARSACLLEAKIILADKLPQATNTEAYNALKSAIDYLSSIPLRQSEETSQIDERILNHTSILANNPTRENAIRFGELIQRRNSLVRILNQ